MPADSRRLMRVAVCDDEAASRELLCRYLKEWAANEKINLETVCYASGSAFWFAWLEDRTFDLLVLDIEMKNLNGMQLAEKIRQQDQKLPILFVTGYADYMAQGYEVAALHYLMKPIHKEKFFQVLNRVKRMAPPEEKLFIRIYIDIMKKQLYISVTNSAKGRAGRGGVFQSSKGESHGLGLLRIDSIVEKYNGILNRQSENGVFATEVLLPLTE